MAKVPEINSLTIMGKEIKIEIDDKACDVNNCDGFYYNESICLREEYDTVNRMIEVLSHEAFHALCATIGIQMNIMAEEVLAKTVGLMTTEIINKIMEHIVCTLIEGEDTEMGLEDDGDTEMPLEGSEEVTEDSKVSTGANIRTSSK